MKSVKKMAATLFGFVLFILLATPANAEIIPYAPFETASKMYLLGILQGKGTLESGDIDFDLGSNITRAEMVTTIVRSFGAEQAAQLAKGAPSFADVNPSDWYSGYVAMAKNLAEQAGNTIGRDLDTFDPNAYVSKAEALVFMMKYLGIKVEQTGANWYEGWIHKAIELGLISEADAEVVLHNPGAPATRGEAFVLLDFGYSAKVLEGGNSLYTSFVDSVAPMVTVDSLPEITTTSEVILTGTVRDNKGVALLSISDGTSQSQIEITDGRWQVTVPLKPGQNSFTIEAVDIAGNTASKQFNIERIAVDRLLIKNKPSQHAVGYPYYFEAELLDAKGNVYQTDIPVQWTASGGSIDQNGRFISYVGGIFTVTATWGDLVDTAQVNVVIPAVYITPKQLNLHPLADQEWCEGDTVSLTLEADIPIDASSSAQFEVIGLPSWLHLNQFTGEITGTVPYDAAGVYNLTANLTAYDYPTSTISFKVTVLDTDTTPYWDSLLSQGLTVSMLYPDVNLEFFAYDDDGDNLTFIGVELDPYVVLNGSVLTALNSGTYIVTIKVRDDTPSADPSLDEAIITFTLIVTG